MSSPTHLRRRAFRLPPAFIEAKASSQLVLQIAALTDADAKTLIKLDCWHHDRQLALVLREFLHAVTVVPFEQSPLKVPT